MSSLYIISTPIGNLEDITLRALRILREVDVILCEDTRVTKRLLDRHEIIPKKLMPYNEHKSGVGTKTVLALLEDGKDVALVCDSGTPTISDPGSRLVCSINEELGDEVDIIPVPGPSALIATISASGMSADNFLFLGFLPHKKGREKLFKEIADSKRTIVFYESPHRIMKTLESLAQHLPEQARSGDGSSTVLEPSPLRQAVHRQVVVARELTKIHEEIVGGNAKEVLAYYKNNPDKVRGEFVVVVGNNSDK